MHCQGWLFKWHLHCRKVFGVDVKISWYDSNMLVERYGHSKEPLFWAAKAPEQPMGFVRSTKEDVLELKACGAILAKGLNQASYLLFSPKQRGKKKVPKTEVPPKQRVPKKKDSEKYRANSSRDRPESRMASGGGNDFSRGQKVLAKRIEAGDASDPQEVGLWEPPIGLLE